MKTQSTGWEQVPLLLMSEKALPPIFIKLQMNNTDTNKVKKKSSHFRKAYLEMSNKYIKQCSKLIVNGKVPVIF